MKHWIFTKPINLIVVKPRGRHYAVHTPGGWIEKDENIVVTLTINNIYELKKLRMNIRKGKYHEITSSPICDQLWATIAHRSGLLRIVEIEEEDDET